MGVGRVMQAIRMDNERNRDFYENENHVKNAYSAPAFQQRTRVLLFALQYEIQGKITLSETGDRQGLGGPDLKEWQSAVAETNAALLKEWDDHLHVAHPCQWEREQSKRARRRAKVAE